MPTFSSELYWGKGTTVKIISYEKEGFSIYRMSFAVFSLLQMSPDNMLIYR